MGEWFFNRTSGLLYVWPNNTVAGGPSPEKGPELIASKHTTLIKLTGGVSNVTIAQLTFRDAAPTFLEKWGVPSGGDWALYRVHAQPQPEHPQTLSFPAARPLARFACERRPSLCRRR